MNKWTLAGLGTVAALHDAPPVAAQCEMTGYEVANLPQTIAKAQAAGVAVLVKPYVAEHREAAMLQFPGGYIAEVRAPALN